MLDLDTRTTALLVMDYQDDIVSMVGDKAAPMLERARTTIAAARKAQVAIVYVVVGFRPGYPELSSRNPSFASVSKSGRFVVTTPGADIAEIVRPASDDVVVVKRRVSAFSGSDLDMVLRAKRIDTLALMGISTSGVVLSTVRQAADADYRLVVVKDCCVDGDDDVHRVLTEKVFVRQSTVVAATELVAALGG